MTHTQTINAMLEAIDIKETGRLVYLDLLEHGASSARMLSQRCSIPRTSVYDHLAPLITRGLVVEKERGQKTLFEIHDVRDLGRLVSVREDAFTLLRARFDHIKHTLPFIQGKGEPKIKFFEGREGLEALLHEMLWDAESDICTVWPYHEMLAVLGSDALASFNEKRVRQKIRIASIWVGARKRKAHIWHGADDFVTRKIAPKSCVTRMGYSIYGNKVAFISSGAEQYGFIVHSVDFAKLMRMQFDLLWSVSK